MKTYFLIVKPNGERMLHTLAETEAEAQRKAEVGSAKLKWPWFVLQGYTVQAVCVSAYNTAFSVLTSEEFVKEKGNMCPECKSLGTLSISHRCEVSEFPDLSIGVDCTCCGCKFDMNFQLSGYTSKE